MNDVDVTTIERCLGWGRFAELLKDKLATGQCACSRPERRAAIKQLYLKKKWIEYVDEHSYHYLHEPTQDEWNEYHDEVDRFIGGGALPFTQAILEPLGIWPSMSAWLVINDVICDCCVLRWLTVEMPAQLEMFGGGVPTLGKICGDEEKEIVQ
jgi:hypothetical protein